MTSKKKNDTDDIPCSDISYSDISYSGAVKELEEILGEIEGADVDIDLLAGRVERASELVKLLKARIRSTEVKVARVVEELREATEEEEEARIVEEDTSFESGPEDSIPF